MSYHGPEVRMRWTAAVGALWLVGCASQVAQSEPRSWDGDFWVDSVLITCDTLSWTYDVGTLGWGDEVTVDLVGREFGAVAIREHHALAEVEHGEDWARFQVELDQASAEYAASQSTALACDAKTFVTYGFAAWRYDGEMQECVAWGIDPEGEFPQCANWGADGHSVL